ncbi:MAG: hypothetical protein U1E51_13265, partial [Candidatus Binatia bacterium]|nr:hypothetical protein [Candidatus Binatia bacterium]
AHHVAELMQKSIKGSTAAERSNARKTATETILKIWQHRTSLPGNAYPLARYKEILKVLELLRPDDNPFKHFGHDPGVKRDQLAAGLFGDLSRLTIALLLMKVQSEKKSIVVSAVAGKTLTGTERHVLKALQQWGDLFKSPAKKSGRARKRETTGDPAKLNLDEAALSLIDSISNMLVELRNEIQKSTEPTPP